MTFLQRIFQHLQKNTSWFGILILPYYFTRFVISSVKNRSLCFYRYPMGHYGSTIPSKSEIQNREEELFDVTVETIPGVNLYVDNQLALLREFSRYDRTFPTRKDPASRTRYYSDNSLFSSSDALILYCVLKYFKPPEVIEIGSGFSSALMLDIKETELPDLALTFIEPYPATLNNLIYEEDRNNNIIQEKIQDVDPGLFDQLDEGSILFIDSSHVLKIGSDLSTIFFSIMPRLRSGVIVHIHDIFWPFEYPRHMLHEGRVWNEAYFVRSFLQFNNTYEIMFFSSYIQKHHPSVLSNNLKSYVPDSGSSLWLRKVR